MTPKIFKPEDFDINYPLGGRNEAIANHCNELFAAWLEQQQVVYGHNFGDGLYLWDSDSADNDTHTARLVCIEPLKKCERHEPELVVPDATYYLRAYCKNCGMALVAEWKEA